MSILWTDFETRSRCDLKTKGVYNYTLDGSTTVLCMAYAFDDEDVVLWTPDQPFPERVRQHTGQIRAHNATFERLVFECILDCDFKLEQYYCTATQARANCLPGSLEDAGRAISSAMRKDHRGNELVRKCCCPPFKHTAQDLQDLFDYSLQDVRAMRAISQSLRDLSAQELADYHINERINDRGVLVDVPLCKAAMQYALDETTDIERRVIEASNGEVTSVRSPRMREWVWNHVGAQARKLMTTYKDGEAKQSIDKNVRANLLALAEEDKDEVPENVAEVVACADDLWASSTAKFSRLAALADDEDDRIRGAFVFAGGSATGRASSYGAQVHNFPRKCAEVPEDVRRAMVCGSRIVPQYGKRTTDVLKGMLRPALMAPKGRVFVAYDWSAIEGRVNPWLAKSDHGEHKLNIFRTGMDVYKVNAAATFGVHYDQVTKDQRQIGKVQELALGFSGGVGAFASMGRIYGVLLPEHEAQRMVDLWRRANPWAMPWWQALENAYTRALRHDGNEFHAGRVAYMRRGEMLWYILPSGRLLCYPFAKFNEAGEIEYLKSSWKPAADAKAWPRSRLWRGLACENITQATAHDLLRHSLREMEKDGLQVVLHIHDEIVVECAATEAEQVQARMKEIMTTPPAWADGLPLEVSGDIMERFSK